MSADFTGRVPSVPTIRPDNFPTAAAALSTVVALFLLCSLLLFACHRFSPAAPPPAPRFQTRPQPERAAPPAPALAVAALPLVPAPGEGCCAVCLGPYAAAERVKLMPVCRHVFHPGCIDTWLLSRGSCPVCRCSDLGGAGEIRLDLYGCKWEEEEEVAGSSSSARVEVEGIGKTTVFLRHSCSF